MSFWANLAVTVALYVLSAYFKPRPKRDISNIQIPRVGEGTRVPIGFGTFEVSPILVGQWNTFNQEGDDNSTEYFANLLGVLCMGPVDALVDIQFDDRSLRLAPKTTPFGGWTPDGWELMNLATSKPFPMYTQLYTLDPIEFFIDADELFGGSEDGGGIVGGMHFHCGVINPPSACDFTEHHLGVGNGSGYPGICYVTFGLKPGVGGFRITDGSFMHGSNDPRLRPCKFILARYPRALLGSEYPGLAYSPKQDPARIGVNANPIEVIYELATDVSKGRGISTARFDTANWVAAAITCRNEGMGVSGSVTEDEDAEDVIQDLLTHIGGVIYEDPVTALVCIKLIRADYDVAELETLDSEIIRDWEYEEPSWNDTVNELMGTYRHFAGFESNNVIEDEVLTSYVQRDVEYQVGGRRITDVVVKEYRADSTVVTLTEGAHYELDSVEGKFKFDAGGAIWSVPQTGSMIKVSYTGADSFIGFKEGHVRETDIANYHMTGNKRFDEIHFTMFSDDLAAKRATSRALRVMSTPWPKVSFKCDRRLFRKVPGDVIKIDYTWEDPDTGVTLSVTGLVVRINGIKYGTVDDPDIEVHGTMDAFTAVESPSGSTTVSGSSAPVATAPAIAAIYCISPGAIRIGIQVTDDSFPFEIERSDDAAGLVNATIITPAGGEPGTSTYFDDPQSVGTTKYYHARTKGVGINDGPWTDRISCTASAGTPGDPSYVAPTIVETVTETTVLGTVALGITDPQNRLYDVAFRTWDGVNAQTGWVTDSFPYEMSVAFDGDNEASVTYRVRAYDSTGQLITFVEKTVTFKVPAPPVLIPSFDTAGNLSSAFVSTGKSIRIAGAIGAAPADAAVDAAAAVNLTSGSTGTLATAAALTDTGYVKARSYSGENGTGRFSDYVTVSLQRTQSDAAEESIQMLSVPVPIWAGGFDEATPVFNVTSAVMEPRQEWRIPLNLTGYKRIRIWAQTVNVAPVFGVKAAAQYSLDGGSSWAFFDTDESGPWVRLSGDLDMKTGLYYDIPSIARDEVEVRVVFYGGDGSTDVWLQCVGLTLDAFANVIIPTPNPGGEVISSCLGTDTIPVEQEIIVAWHISDCGAFSGPGGGNVDTLTDISGNGHTYGTSTVSGNWTTRATGDPVNGRTPIHHNSSWLEWPAGTWDEVAEAEMWLVIRAAGGDPNPTSNYQGFHKLGSSSSEISMYSDYDFANPGVPGSGIIFDNFFSTTLHEVGTLGIMKDGWHLYRSRSRSGLWQAFVNGDTTPYYESLTNAVGINSTPHMGARGGGSDNSNIVLMEQLYLKEFVSDAKALEIAEAIMTRWNL